MKNRASHSSKTTRRRWGVALAALVAAVSLQASPAAASPMPDRPEVPESVYVDWAARICQTVPRVSVYSMNLGPWTACACYIVPRVSDLDLPWSPNAAPLVAVPFQTMRCNL